jgi:hypothetical protein
VSHHPKRYVELLTLRLLLGNSVIADVINKDEVRLESGPSMTSDYIRRRPCEGIETQGTSCENGDRDCSEASTSQLMPRIASHHQKPGRKHAPETSERINPDNTLILDM